MTTIEITNAKELPPVQLLWWSASDIERIPAEYTDIMGRAPDVAYRLKSQVWVPVEQVTGE